MPKSGKEARTLLVPAGNQHNKKARHRVVPHPKRKKATHNSKDNLPSIPSAPVRGREVTSAILVTSRMVTSAKCQDKNFKEEKLSWKM